MADFEEYNSGADYRRPCPVCGRKFLPESLAKHKPICHKNAAKKRKVFDSTKQRAEGTDVKYKDMKKAQKQPNVIPKSNWRAQHQDFVNSIRAARGAQQAINSGKPLPPPPPPSLNPDYVECPHCERRFNKKAAERHMPFCKEQHSRLNAKPKLDASTKTRVNARTQYQAPRPKPKTGYMASPQNSNLGRFSDSSSRSPGGSAGRSGILRSNQGRNNSNGYGSHGDDQPIGGNTRRTSGGFNGHQPDFDEPLGSPGTYEGRALRTGRDAKSYENAKRDARNTGGPKRMPPGHLGYSDRNTSPPGPYSRGSNSHDSDYNSPSPSSKRQTSAGSKFCHECGTKFPVMNAKFCCNCGLKRTTIQ